MIYIVIKFQAYSCNTSQDMIFFSSHFVKSQTDRQTDRTQCIITAHCAYAQVGSNIPIKHSAFGLDLTVIWIVVCLRGLANLGPGVRTDLQRRTSCNRLLLEIAKADGPSVSLPTPIQRDPNKSNQILTSAYLLLLFDNRFFF